MNKQLRVILYLTLGSIFLAGFGLSIYGAVKYQTRGFRISSIESLLYASMFVNLVVGGILSTLGFAELAGCSACKCRRHHANNHRPTNRLDRIPHSSSPASSHEVISRSLSEDSIETRNSNRRSDLQQNGGDRERLSYRKKPASKTDHVVIHMPKPPTFSKRLAKIHFQEEIPNKFICPISVDIMNNIN